VYFVSETAQIELKSGRVFAPSCVCRHASQLTFSKMLKLSHPGTRFGPCISLQATSITLDLSHRETSVNRTSRCGELPHTSLTSSA
jgi:hypothetical protein